MCTCVCELGGCSLRATSFVFPGMGSTSEKQGAGNLALFLQQNSGECDEVLVVRVHLLVRFSAAIPQNNFLFYSLLRIFGAEN